MNTHLTLNNAAPPDIRACPPELRVVAPEVVKHIVGLMTLHGIKSLGGDMELIGAKSLVSNTVEAIPGAEPPPTLTKMRWAVGRMLIDYMTLMGIHGIDIEPSAAEVSGLNVGYDEIRKQAAALLVVTPPKASPTGDADGVAIEVPEFPNV
jgi:hypothetical protein